MKNIFRDIPSRSMKYRLNVRAAKTTYWSAGDGEKVYWNPVIQRFGKLIFKKKYGRLQWVENTKQWNYQ